MLEEITFIFNSIVCHSQFNEHSSQIIEMLFNIFTVGNMQVFELSQWVLS